MGAFWWFEGAGSPFGSSRFDSEFCLREVANNTIENSWTVNFDFYTDSIRCRTSENRSMSDSDIETQPVAGLPNALRHPSDGLPGHRRPDPARRSEGRFQRFRHTSEGIQNQQVEIPGHDHVRPAVDSQFVTSGHIAFRSRLRGKCGKQEPSRESKSRETST